MTGEEKRGTQEQHCPTRSEPDQRMPYGEHVNLRNEARECDGYSPHLALAPPSMEKMEPVTYSDSSEAR